MATYSGAKIAKAVIKANVNFWGGKNIPIIQSVMNFAFDPKKVLDQFKVDPKTKSETTKYIGELEKYHDEALQAEMDFEAMKKAYSKLIVNMLNLELIITTILSTAFVNRIAHSVSNTLINNYKLQNKVQPHNFYAIDNVLNIDKALRDKYYEGIANLKKLEQQMARQDSLVKQKYNNVKTKTEALIKKTAQNKKKK